MNAVLDAPSALIWGFRFQGGRALPATEFDLTADFAKGEGWVWLHFPLGDLRARAFLKGFEAIPLAARDLMLSDESRPQFQFAEGWVNGILPDMQRDLAGRATGAGRLHFVASERLLVTARLHALRVVDDVRHECERHGRAVSPVAAVVRFVERYVDLCENRAHQIAEELDRVEDLTLVEESELEAVRLGPTRREVSRNHREFTALRSALHRAMGPREPHALAALSEHLPRLAQEVEDLSRESVSLQDRARLLHEEIDTRITGATNRSMRALTIISTLLIPPTLIVGAFGMNVGGIPWASGQGGFVAASILCLTVVGAAWWMLRRMRIL